MRILFLQYSFSLQPVFNFISNLQCFLLSFAGFSLHTNNVHLLNLMFGSLEPAAIFVIDSKSLAEFPGRLCLMSLGFLLGNFLRILSVKCSCVQEEKQFLRYYFHEEA